MDQHLADTLLDMATEIRKLKDQGYPPIGLLNELGAALAKAQAAIATAERDSENTATARTFKYASLDAIWQACRKALSDNGLSVIQMPRLIEEMRLLEVETTLLHSSGQFIRGALAIPLERLDAWAIGSATTYARKYALAAIVGVAPEDDDGVGAMGERKPTEPGEVLTVTGRISEVKLPKRGANATIKAAGLEFKTQDRQNIQKAQAACDSNTEVTIGYLAGKWDNKLVEIAEVGAREEAIL